MSVINNWIFNLVFTIIFVVIFTQCFKLLTKTSLNDGALTVVTQFIGGLAILCLTPLFKLQFPSDWKIWSVFTLSILTYAISDRLSTTARANLEVSSEIISRQLAKVLIILIGLVIFKEKFVLLKILGGFVIILANVFLFVEKKAFTFDKHLIIQLVSISFNVIGVTLDIGISEHFNLAIYIGLTLIIPSLLIFIFERIPLRKVIAEYQNADKKILYLTCVAWGFGALLGLRSYLLGDLSTVSPLSSLSVIINVFSAYVFLNEKENLLKKVISAFGILLGVLLIALG